MKAFPVTDDLAKIARRIVWFEPPELSLSDPVRFLAYAMARATAEDMAKIRQYISDRDFIVALDTAPPGIIDPRSWSYWNLVVAGRQPAPPMPVRRFA
ncbi:hypothetical protein [Acidiphilium sp.]|jgi:hypothetical protein|uniref:hypothetical protein n=1 Tax=Acidiphilium sp. TaxID=527 RepID=UPI00258FF3A5|nr:hypothetical protein [Acidiphilium sp.]